MQRLVINYRLVLITVKILSSLYEKNMFVNEIIEQTSKDRTFIIKAINTLEKGKFIENIKSLSHKQKKVKKLTSLGRELANLTINVENFNEEFLNILLLREEFLELDEGIGGFQKKEFQDIHSTFMKKNRLDIIKDKKKTNSDKILEIKLKGKGWTDIEINYYEECKSGIYYTIIYLQEGLVKVLLQKFIFILDKFELNVVAREIINNIIIERLQVQLSSIVTNIHNRYTKYLTEYQKNDNDKIDYSTYYPSFKFEPLEYIEKIRYPFSISVREIVEKLIVYYLNLLKPPKETIELHLNGIKNDIENAPAYEIDETDMNREELIMRSRCLISAYEKYLNSN